MGRFASTVPYYQHTRQPYGASFFATVAQALTLDGSQRLLDLGTGPGLLALGFAPFVGETLGVDPEPAMLQAARENAERSGVALRLLHGKAETLPFDLGVFDVVTIGRALHWMDPEPTRTTLDRVVREDGAILICSASSVSDGRNPWLAPYEALRKRWSEDMSRVHYAERSTFFDPTGFRKTETISVETEQIIGVHDLADRVLSMSSSSPDKLGIGMDIMRAEVQEALSPFAKNGVVEEIVEAKAEVLRRKGRSLRSRTSAMMGLMP